MKPDNGKVMEISQLVPLVLCGNGVESVCVLSSTPMNHTHFDFIYVITGQALITKQPVQQHQLSKFYEIYWNIMALLWPITSFSVVKTLKWRERRKLALFHAPEVLSQLEGFGRSAWHLCSVSSMTSVHLNHSVTCLSCHARRWKHMTRGENLYQSCLSGI